MSGEVPPFQLVLGMGAVVARKFEFIAGKSQSEADSQQPQKALVHRFILSQGLVEEWTENLPKPSTCTQGAGRIGTRGR